VSMRAISTYFGMVLVVAAASGCLRKEVAHTVYLGPSGVVWAVTESGVRSDEHEPSDRRRAEYEYAVAATAGVHPIAEAFHRLGAQSVTATWLRRERPYAVMTEARFADVRQLALALLDDVGAQGEVGVTREACRTRLEARINADEGPDTTPDSPVDGLLADLYAYRFVLTDGRFVAADGFEIREDGAVAVPDREKAAADGVLLLSLTWADDGCAVR
ncbi:MAG TPA: hypothetical protein VMZ66_08545, partial [Aeromicrobium sp.]|nr:hypothetical protein [Aeromicrobium sp.]